MCVAWLVSFRALNYSPMQISADEGGGGVGGGCSCKYPLQSEPFACHSAARSPAWCCSPKVAEERVRQSMGVPQEKNAFLSCPLSRY